MRAVWTLLIVTLACAGPRRGDPSNEPAAPQAEVQPRHSDEILWKSIGTSVEGRPIRCRRVGHGPRRVLWIGGIHGNEREGSVATAELASAFRAAGLVASVTLTIVEDCNPDGSAAGTRGNANGVDLNRNFPASNARPGTTPLSEPESRALHDLIVAGQPHAVLVAHSWGVKARGPKQFINFDGPAEDLARTFSSISGYELLRSYRMPPTRGSLGSWVGIDMQVPILTIEYMRGKDPTEAWIDTREAILAVIAG